ncbi:MAG: DUF3006 domain-containing protein [Bacillota bacterium]|nr:DUF3006 domain-containing protein [Bacillota bacterium]
MIIIDRFEGEIAVVEYEKGFYNMPRAWLPSGAKEGDVIVLKAAIDEVETAKRRDEMKRKMEDLFE